MKSSQHPTGTVVLTVDYPTTEVAYIFYPNGKTTIQSDNYGKVVLHKMSERLLDQMEVGERRFGTAEDTLDDAIFEGMLNWVAEKLPNNSLRLDLYYAKKRVSFIQFQDGGYHKLGVYDLDE